MAGMTFPRKTKIVIGFCAVILLVFIILNGAKDEQQINLSYVGSPGTYAVTASDLQTSRLSVMHAYCDNLDLSQEDTDIQSYLTRNQHFLNSLENTMLIDDKHRVILRSIPKTGCSTWRLMFLNNSVTGFLKVNKMMEEDIHVPSYMKRYNLKALVHYSPSDGLYRLQNYFSILTVRHPLDRIESAYVDKFTKPNIYNFIKEKHSSRILKMYRGQTLENADPKTIQFEEFLRYLVEYPRSDIHWRSVWDQAHPCVLKYHYIAKQETMSMDLDYVARMHLSGKQVSLTLKSWRQGGDAEMKGKWLPLFSKLTDPEAWIQKLLVHIGPDMEMFGYSYEIINNNIYATCKRYTPDMVCV